MKKILLAVAMVAALGSCSKNEVFLNESDDNAIGFSTYMSGVSKADVTYSEDGEDSKVFTTYSMRTTGFGVYGFYTGSTDFNSLTEAIAPNLMYNQYVQFQGNYSTNNDSVNSDWQYDPVKYWSNTSGDKYTFFAYAPYSDGTSFGIENLSSSSYAGVPLLKFTINNEATTMVDFVAGQMINETKSSETASENVVDFNLKHQLTRVMFSAKTDETLTSFGEDQTTVVVTSMKFIGNNHSGDDYTNYQSTGLYQYATYEFDTDDTNDDKTNHNQDGTWTMPTNPRGGDFNFTSILAKNNEEITVGESVVTYKAAQGAAVSNIETDYTPLFQDDMYLFLLPPNGSTGLNVSSTNQVFVELVYDVVTKDSELAKGFYSTTNTIVVELTRNTMKQGFAYNYQLLIGLDRIEVSALVLDWDEREENNYSITF